jgi:hypothetical protein
MHYKYAARQLQELAECCFGSWQQYVLKKVAGNPSSLSTMRKLLRRKTNCNTERKWHLRQVLRQVLRAWAAKVLCLPRRAHQHRLLLKGLTGWQAATHHTLQLLQQFHKRWHNDRLLCKAQVLWRAVVVLLRQQRKAAAAAQEWHNRSRLSHVVRAWRRQAAELAAEGALSLAAYQYRPAPLMRRMLRVCRNVAAASAAARYWHQQQVVQKLFRAWQTLARVNAAGCAATSPNDCLSQHVCKSCTAMQSDHDKGCRLCDVGRAPQDACNGRCCGSSYLLQHQQQVSLECANQAATAAKAQALVSQHKPCGQTVTGCHAGSTRWSTEDVLRPHPQLQLSQQLSWHLQKQQPSLPHQQLAVMSLAVQAANSAGGGVSKCCRQLAAAQLTSGLTGEQVWLLSAPAPHPMAPGPVAGCNSCRDAKSNGRLVHQAMVLPLSGPSHGCQAGSSGGQASLSSLHHTIPCRKNHGRGCSCLQAADTSSRQALDGDNDNVVVSSANGAQRWQVQHTMRIPAMTNHTAVPHRYI